MKRILYYMHVDWRWIKQRPHFLAEELSEYYKVNVIHEILYGSNKQKKSKNRIANLKLTAMPHIPFCRFDSIFNINAFIMNRILLRNRIKKADVIWMGSPLHYKYVKRKEGQILVYDCMDDLMGFSFPENIKKRYIKYEAELCKDADIIFASSLDLKRKLAERYDRHDVKLVNNAISSNLRRDCGLPDDIRMHFDKSDGTKKMVYIGTISEWFDFDSVLRVLSECDKVELLLFGPADVEIPQHNRIKYCGIAEHKNIYGIMGKADALVMPFVLNELIMSVDPVKAYEYIYAYKPIIMPRYPESEKFSEYVNLYSGERELLEIVKRLQSGNLEMKKSKEEYVLFAESNTWRNRAQKIHSYLSDLKK